MARRAGLGEFVRAAADRDIRQHLEHFIAASAFTHLFAYAAFRGEPNLEPLRPLLPHLQFALPVVGGEAGHMQFHAWLPDETLVANRWGIDEPNPRRAPLLIPDNKTLILAPCVAVDRRGYRLGYGGGYYDRFLAQYRHTGVKLVGIVHAALLVEEIPAETHDLVMDAVVSEEGCRIF